MTEKQAEDADARGLKRKRRYDNNNNNNNNNEASNGIQMLL